MSQCNCACQTDVKDPPWGAAESDLYVPQSATLKQVEPMTDQEAFFDVTLDSGEPLGHLPGQFVMVSVPGIGEAPISISSSPSRNGSFQMVVRNMGNVSGAMHKLQAGDKLGIRGPFGTSFPVDSELRGRDLLFICGGIGLVPVRSAIHYVLDHRSEYGKVTILFGAKTPADRLFTNELAEWVKRDDITFAETVDRGDNDWTGNVGVITTLIPDVEIDPGKTGVIICGPPIMYKFVIMELMTKNLSAETLYVSLERRMKCGVGKCGHCQINGLYACQDGPVFKYSDVADIAEAI